MSNISKINGLDISAADAQYVAAGNVDGPLGYNSVEAANTASYVSPTFISASAAAAGFGTAGSTPSTASWAIQAQTASFSTTLGASIVNPTAGQLRLRNSNGTTISTIDGFTASLATSASFASTSSNYTDSGGGTMRATAVDQTQLSGIKIGILASNRVDISSSLGTFVNGYASFFNGEANFAGTRVWVQANTPFTASNVLITGSTNFNNTGYIYPAPNGGGVQIEGDTRIFLTASNQITLGAVNGIAFNQGAAIFNKGVVMTALTSQSMAHVLTYNPSNGAVHFTASSAIGAGGGSSTSASFASTASFVNTLNQNVTILGNLTVFGTASYTLVSASQLNVGTNTISVNVFEPAQRFGGLVVYDSGSLSHQATSSFLWDSEKNKWIYQNVSGSGYDGGMAMFGPRNTAGLGNEQGTTNNALMKGQGGDHITSSRIFDDGTNVYTNSDVQITGSLTVTGNVIATASWASNAVSASYINPTFISASAAAAGFGSGGDGPESDPIFAAWSGSAASYFAGTASYATQALTASYALSSAGVAGGVTSITAGDGISVDQSTGNVTITNTGGSSTPGTNLGLVYAVSLGYLMP